MTYGPASWNGISITIQSIKRSWQAGTVKQMVSYNISEHKVLGRNVRDRILTLSFRIVDTAANIDTARTAIENSMDAQPHAFNDGVNDGQYVAKMGDIECSENSRFKTLLEGTMRLTQYQQ